MTAQGITTTALDKMTELETLMSARRQAAWQRYKSAGENKAIWYRIIDIQDNRIKALEREISRCLGIPGFRARRGAGT